MKRLRSKPLILAESNDLKFVQEMLLGDNLSSIGVATIMYHPIYNKYIIFEYLLCEENQVVSPHSSHPNRYWFKNSGKFKALFKLQKTLNAVLYLVNYAKPKTKHCNEVTVIKVQEINNIGISKQIIKKYTREEFSSWYRNLNKECNSK